MNFAKVILGNFRRDFKKLLPMAPGYLNCRIVVGHGNCTGGFTSSNTKEDGMTLIKSDGFEFEKVPRVISAFSSSKSREPLLLCVNLMIPSGTICIYRLYEIEKIDNDILLINQSCGG